MRRVFVGAAAVLAALGWLQLAPALGFPVTAPAAMLDRLFGPLREAGPVGWVLLLLGMAGIAAGYLLTVEARTRGPLPAFLYAATAWLVSGAVVMPIVGLIQGSPPPGDAANDPMRATFFMSNLGPGAAVEALIAWMLFGAVLAGGRSLALKPAMAAAGAAGAVAAAGLALALPALALRSGPERVVEGPVASLPASPYISILELPQPPGAVLGPHSHVAGFVLDVFGTASVVDAGGAVRDIGPGEAAFIAGNLVHSHANRAAAPLALGLTLVMAALTVGLLVLGHRTAGPVLLVCVLVAGALATADPFMNHWYFIGVRPAAARGGGMPVPAAHRTLESANLSGLGGGPYLERLTETTLRSGGSLSVSGPAAVVVLDGQVVVIDGTRSSSLEAQSGTTIGGGVGATVRAASGGARVVIVEVRGSV